MADLEEDNTPVNLLSLDGGGIRGVSELLILHEIMCRLQHDLKLDELPLPCDYFHLIGGTSTGGLIAIMLGRLRMSTKEALAQYKLIASNIFSKENKKWKTQDGYFKASTLVRDMRSMVESRTEQSDRSMKMLELAQHNSRGKAFVCAMPANNMEHPRRFRTYKVRSNASPDCEIWEAARATTAAPTFFKRISVGEEGQIPEQFIDGGLRCNNPVKEVLEEARLLFGGKRRLGCLISIGTGHKGTIGLQQPDAFQKILPTNLITALQQISTDCESTADEMERRFQNQTNRYFRFSVRHGAEQISLEEWKKLDEVTTHTISYLHSHSVTQSVDAVVRRLRNTREGPDIESSGGLMLDDTCLIRTECPTPTIHFKKQPRSSPRFTGRGSFLDQLSTFFSIKPQRAGPGRIFALTGMGGAGKTQICLKFTEDSSERFPYVFWIDATSDETAKQSFKSIVSDSEIDIPGAGDSPEQVLRRLSKLQTQWLLIIDNADREHPGEIEPYLPYGIGANAIITSRNPSMKTLASSNGHAKIDIMKDEEAITLLLRSACLDDMGPDHRLTAQKIVSELHFLALAIDQAGSYVGQGYCSLNQYLELYHKQRSYLLNHSEMKGASQYERAVYSTWDVSLEAIKDRSIRGSAPQRTAATNALLILKLFGFFHFDNIMEEIFRRAAKSADDPELLHDPDDPENKMNRTYPCLPKQLLALDESGNWDARDFRGGIQVLVSLSLVKRNLSGEKYSLHPLVHAYSLDQVNGSDITHFVRAACAVLSYSLRAWESGQTNILFQQALMPHLLSASRIVGMKGLLELIGDIECESFGFVYNRFRDRNAVLFAESAVEKQTQVLGLAHQRTLLSMRNVATSLKNLGNLSKAEKLYKDLLDIHSSSVGAEHEITLFAMLDLGDCYREARKLNAAEDLLVPALKIMNEVLGEESLKVTEAEHRLATLYSAQRKFSKSEMLYREVLRKKRRLLDESDIDMLQVRWELAVLYLRWAKYSRAETESKKGLEVSLKAYGEDHPVSCMLKSILAQSLMCLGRIDESIGLFEGLLQRSRELYGDEHWGTLQILCQIAQIKIREGELVASKEIYEAILLVLNRTFGLANQAQLATECMQRLGEIAREEGKKAEARKILCETLQLRKAHLGQDHWNTMYSMRYLADFSTDEDPIEAQRLYEEVLAIRRRDLGEEHEETLLSKLSLAIFFWKQGDKAKALTLQEEVLEGRRKVLGEDHEDTSQGKHNLKALEGRRKVLGEEHKATLRTKHILGFLFREQGDKARALKMLEEALVGRRRTLGVDDDDSYLTLGWVVHVKQELEDEDYYMAWLQFLRYQPPVEQVDNDDSSDDWEPDSTGESE
ncbi:hypothetical protein MMC11_003566 [Xylographa trunciseda]|nr:hypothetical protein [Xylographa trunciseda]